jgi:hypothetical protein
MPYSLNLTAAPVSATTVAARYELADKLEKVLANDKPWYEFETAEEYRRARREGLNGFKRPFLNESAKILNVTARDGHAVELRIISPSSSRSRGVWLHFHAGQFCRFMTRSKDCKNSNWMTQVVLLSAPMHHTIPTLRGWVRLWI